MPRRRSSGDGGLFYVESRGLWRGVIDVGFHPDGRRKQKIVTSRTQKGARDKLDVLRQELATHDAPLDKKTTVKDWADVWLEKFCRRRMKPNGLAAYESVTRQWIVPTLGPKKVAALKPSDVLAVERKIIGDGRSSATARKAYNVLKLMLEAARREGLCARNVAMDVDPPKVKEAEGAGFSREDAIRVVRAAYVSGDTRWLVALMCGLRQSERLGLRISAFNEKAATLTVEWALDEIPFDHDCGGVAGAWACGKKRGGSCPKRRLRVPHGFDYEQLAGRLCLVRPKSGQTRKMDLMPEMVAAIQNHIDANTHLPNPHGLIWRHADGSPYLPKEDQASWRDLLRRAGGIEEAKLIPGSGGPTSHVARHTTVTAMMELGVDAKVVGVLVGHQSEKVTRRYQHVMDDVTRDAVKRMAVAFKDAFRPIEP